MIENQLTQEHVDKAQKILEDCQEGLRLVSQLKDQWDEVKKSSSQE